MGIAIFMYISFKSTPVNSECQYPLISYQTDSQRDKISVYIFQDVADIFTNIIDGDVEVEVAMHVVSYHMDQVRVVKGE